MEPQVINLYPLDRRMKYQPVLLFILGVIYIVLGFLYLSDEKKNYYWGIIWLVTGLGSFVSSFLIFNKGNKRTLTLHGEKIKANISWKNKFDLSWSELKEIQIKPVSIDLYLNNGNKNSITLDYCDYKTVLLVKEKLIEHAKLKNLHVS
ncbi:MAG: hypothetical protein ACUVT3_07535 [Ignavibacterium sp.]